MSEGRTRGSPTLISSARVAAGSVLDRGSVSRRRELSDLGCSSRKNSVSGNAPIGHGGCGLPVVPCVLQQSINAVRPLRRSMQFSAVFSLLINWLPRHSIRLDTSRHNRPQIARSRRIIG